MRDFIKRRQPAPGTVLGLIALIVAVTGTAIAGPLATTSKLDKKEKKQTRNIVRNEITAAAPNLSVASARNATNAASAQNAANATNAARAQSAGNATNSGAVDGHSAVCPGGTFLRSGVCFDNAASPDIGYTSAVQFCADAGGRLPSISELQSIRGLVDLGTAGNGHWSDVAYEDSGAVEAMSVYGNGILEALAVGAMQPYRCAYNLVR